MSNNDNYYTIDIYTDSNPPPSLIDEIGSLYTNIKAKRSTPVEQSDDFIPPRKEKKKNKKNKVKISDMSDVFETGAFDDDDQEQQEKELLDIDDIIYQKELDEDNDNIIKEQKKGYKKLKKDSNDFKKEFAEELTLLYDLLDETAKFGKSIEKELSSLKGSKVRGVSKYTNDLTELVLSSKQNKLNILKEISAIKKTIADLKIKAESKSKDKDDNSNSPERLASAYFKNILSHGRGNFINNFTNSDYIDDDQDDSRGDLISTIENARNSMANEDDTDYYAKLLSDRLDSAPNPYRSVEGTKYIEYENRNVKLYVKKCIDTGEWEFVAIDKNKCQIDDYPLPSRRDAGRMKFSDDGTYATDSKGRIYNVIEYYLPDNDDDE